MLYPIFYGYIRNSDYLRLYTESVKSIENYYWEDIDNDVNNIIKSGIGHTSGGMINAPDDGWGTLISFVHKDICIQLIYTWNYSKFYIRCNYGGWHDWVKIG